MISSLGSIMVSISACHAEDLGSIPRRDVILGVDILINVGNTILFFSWFKSQEPWLSKNRERMDWKVSYIYYSGP